MFGKLDTRRLIGIALGLGLLVGATATAAAAPPTTVKVPESLARIHYPGTSSQPTVYMAGPVVIPAWLARIQYPGTSSLPTVYVKIRGGSGAPVKTVPYGQIAIPAWLARIQYPGTSSQPTVIVDNTRATGPADSAFDWGSAGVGGGFVAGLGLLVAGAALALRRRHGFAHA